MSVETRTQRTSLLRGPVTDIPGLTTYLAATYLPLAGGTITGEVFIASGGGLYLYDASTELDVPIVVEDGSLLVGGTTLLDNNSTLDASKLGVNTVPDARLSANVARRDQANTFVAVQTLPLGSAASPAIQPTGSTNSGLYWVSATNLSVAVSGTERHRFGSTGQLSNTGGLGIGVSVAVPDVLYARNATGPTAQVQAAGGLKVCNADGSAVAAVQCSTVLVTPVSGDSKIRLNNYLGAARAYVSATNPDEISLRNAGDTASTASLICGNVTASGVITVPTIVAPSDLTLRATSSTMLLQVSNGGFTPCRLGPGVLNGPSQLGLSSTNNASVPNVFLNAISTGEASLTSDSGKTTGGNLTLGNLTASGSIRPGQFTVATLPSAAANTGRTVQVTDSSVDFPGNIGNTVAGGGAFNVDVKSNGTNWRITG